MCSQGGAHALLQQHRNGKGEFHPCEIGIPVSLTVMARIIFQDLGPFEEKGMQIFMFSLG